MAIIPYRGGLVRGAELTLSHCSTHEVKGTQAFEAYRFGFVAANSHLRAL